MEEVLFERKIKKFYFRVRPFIVNFEIYILDYGFYFFLYYVTDCDCISLYLRYLGQTLFWYCALLRLFAMRRMKLWIVFIVNPKYCYWLLFWSRIVVSKIVLRLKKIKVKQEHFFIYIWHKWICNTFIFQDGAFFKSLYGISLENPWSGSEKTESSTNTQQTQHSSENTMIVQHFDQPVSSENLVKIVNNGMFYFKPMEKFIWKKWMSGKKLLWKWKTQQQMNRFILTGATSKI